MNSLILLLLLSSISVGASLDWISNKSLVSSHNNGVEVDPIVYVQRVLSDNIFRETMLNKGFIEILKESTKASNPLVSHKGFGKAREIERNWNGYIYYPTPPFQPTEEIRSLWYSTTRQQKFTNRDLPLASATEILPEPPPVKGNISFPAILIEFQDVKFRPDHNKTYYESLLDNKTSLSLKTYYLENSYGKLNITIDVYGVVVSDYNMAYYGADSGSGIDDANVPIYELAREAVIKADSLIDYSKYDNNGDGYVDAVLIIHAGTGQEWSGNSDDIWSHRWSIYNPPFLDGVYVMDYSLQPEYYPPRSDYPNGASILGVICHEFGHILGLPDLYDTDYSSSGIGEWGLMGAGSWTGVNKPGDNPSHLSAWSKIYLGFSSPKELTFSMVGYNVLLPVETNEEIVKIPIPYHYGEYFLLEYRSTFSGGLFDKALPGSGLLIWHIDENVAFMDWDRDGSSNWDDNAVNNNDTHYMVDLEEYDNYDGSQELQLGINQGEASDVWKNTYQGFSDATEPSAHAYDGTPSGVKIYNISSPLSNISFNIHVNTLELRKSLYLYNETLVIEYNVSIVKNNRLYLENVSLLFNGTRDNEFNIFVFNGSLDVVNSTLSSINPNISYSIQLFNSNLTMLNSILKDSDADLSGSSYSGIVAYNSSLLVRNSTFRRSRNGLVLFSVVNATILNSTIENNFVGVEIFSSSNLTVVKNSFTNNTYGLLLLYSLEINVTNNFFNNDNPIVWGDEVNHFVHNMSKNYVNGFPLVYLVNANNTTLSGEKTALIIVNSTNIKVVNSTLRNLDSGIILAFTKNVTLENVDVRNVTLGMLYRDVNDTRLTKIKTIKTYLGLYIVNAFNFQVENITVTRNYGDGINIYGNSSKFEIKGSNIFGNDGFGIYANTTNQINATLNWWGDENGPEYKSTPDPYYPEELWGNISYNPWLTAPNLDNYAIIKQTQFESKALTSSTITINVTTEFKFNNATNISIFVIEQDTGLKLAEINDTLVGTGNKNYTLSITTPSYRTSLKLNVGSKYKDEGGDWITVSLVPITIVVLPPYPSIKILSPTQNKVIVGTTVKISWQITEGYYPITKTELVFDNGNPIDVTGKTSYTFYDVQEGEHTVTVKVTDTAGHTVSDSVTFKTRKPKKPTITILNPQNESLLPGPNVTVEWEVEKGDYLIAQVLIALDGEDWIDVTAQSNYTFTNLEEGDHNVTIKVVDSAGNSVAEVIYFTVVYPRPPTITIISPQNNTQIETNNITVEWRIETNYYKITKTEIKLDNDTWIDVTNKTSYTFTNVSAGLHEVKIRAVNEAGQITIVTITVTVKQKQKVNQGKQIYPNLPIKLDQLLIILGAIGLIAIIILAVVRRKPRERYTRIIKPTSFSSTTTRWEIY